MPYQASYQSFSDYDNQCSVGYGDYEYGDYYIPDFTFNGVTVCAGPRKAVTATVNPLPATNISPATGPVAVCNLDAKTFTTTSVGNLQWRNASGPISGATSSSYSTGTAGSYSVVVTNPTTGCKDSSAAVTLNIVPRPSVSITPSTVTNICTDSSIMLISTYTGTGLSFMWYKDNVLITGASADSLRISDAGAYTLAAIAASCSDTSNASTLNLIPLPTATFDISDTIKAICAGRPVELEALAIPTGYSYQWLRDDVVIPGATSRKYIASNVGVYQIRITDNNNCRNLSDTISVVVSPLGTPSITPNVANICEGTTLLLIGSGGAYATYYEWQNAGVILPDTTDKLRVSTPGVYSVTVRDIYNCVAKSTQSIVSVYPMPSKPDIVETPGMLSTKLAYSSYQWYRNGKAIAGATNRNFFITFDGKYSVTVTNAAECSNYSDTLVLQNLSIDHSRTATAVAIHLYPNPTSHIINIDAPIVVNATITDMQGRRIATYTATKQIDLQSFADGTYLIAITDSEGSLLQTNRVVKQSN